MNALLRCSLLLTTAAMLLAGCEKSRSDELSHQGDVRLETVSLAKWQEALASQKRKIVVVDTWATWCLPCKEDFPQFVALHDKYAPRDVVCMSVSVDAPEDRGTALEFLQRHEANFDNYLIDDTNNAWLDKWHIKGIPVVLVFNGEGTLVKKFDMDDPDHQFTYSEVEEFVAKMLVETKR